MLYIYILQVCFIVQLHVSFLYRHRNFYSRKSEYNFVSVNTEIFRYDLNRFTMGKMLKGDDGADLDSSFVQNKFEIEEGQENLDYMLRFTNVGRLYERITSATVAGSSLQRLRKAHVCIIGLGGVGSWVVESLARSGIGRYVCIFFYCNEILHTTLLISALQYWIFT
jgi:hypothetical protein